MTEVTSLPNATASLVMSIVANKLREREREQQQQQQQQQKPLDKLAADLIAVVKRNDPRRMRTLLDQKVVAISAAHSLILFVVRMPRFKSVSFQPLYAFLVVTVALLLFMEYVSPQIHTWHCRPMSTRASVPLAARV